MGKIIQKIIKLMPLVLFFMLIFVDREDKIEVFGVLFLLFTYTIILVSRILYAKKVWHKEFNDENYAKDESILKMKDLIKKFDKSFALFFSFAAKFSCASASLSVIPKSSKRSGSAFDTPRIRRLKESLTSLPRIKEAFFAPSANPSICFGFNPAATPIAAA